MGRPHNPSCPDCGIIKTTDNTGNARGHLNTRCRNCTNIRQFARYRIFGRVSQNDGSRNYHLKSKYGITESEFDALSRTQNNKCAICSEIRPLEVDHNHETQYVRGLICRHCNCILGHSFDKIVILQNAIEYLKKNEGKVSLLTLLMKM
jgi:hypothetical protein